MLSQHDHVEIPSSLDHDVMRGSLISPCQRPTRVLLFPVTSFPMRLLLMLSYLIY
jgi:hypothetical protein